MDISPNNTIYWLVHEPLDPPAVRVLRQIKEGTHTWCLDRWSEALLISLKCIEVDFEKQTYSITEKGKEGLEFHTE